MLLVFILLMPSFFSCEYLFDKFIPKKEAAFAKEYLIRLKSRDFDHIKRYLSPKLSAEVNDTKIEEVASYFPSGELINAIIIGSQVTKSAEQWQANLFYEFQFSDGWAIVNVVLEKVGQQLQINHLYINQTIDSQKKLNSFRLHNRSPKHFFVLFLSLLVPLFILVTLYFCIKTPIPKRKWLWILFVSFGIGTIALNWTTGQSWFKLTSGQLLGAGWWADSPYSSWIIKVSIPLGAII